MTLAVKVALNSNTTNHPSKGLFFVVKTGLLCWKQTVDLSHFKTHAKEIQLWLGLKTMRFAVENIVGKEENAENSVS